MEIRVAATRSVAYTALALLVCGGMPPPAAANPSERISVKFMGGETTRNTTYQAISGNGRYVVFASDDDEIVRNDTNNVSDVFRRDLQSQDVVRVSVDATGQEGNGISSYPSISYDGNIVAFTSYATNLAGGATIPAERVYVRDMTRGLTYVASANTASSPAPGTGPILSPDGRFVTFSSPDNSLVPGDAITTGADLFRKDMDADQDGILSSSGPIEIVNRDAAGVQRGGLHQDLGSSELGHLIVFSSTANDLVPGDTNGARDVFLRDTLKGTTEIISVGPNGTQSNGVSEQAVISRDGRYVVFRSRATNLLSQPVRSRFGIYRRDRLRGITELVSGGGEKAGINSSGDVVVYERDAAGLLNVYLRAMSQPSPQPAQLISTQAGSTLEGDDASSGSSHLHHPNYPATVSDDTTVAFISYASDLMPITDGNGRPDLYIQRVPLTNLQAQLQFSQSGASVTATAQVENTTTVASDPVHGHLVIWEALTTSIGSGCVTDPNSTLVVPDDKYVTDTGEVADISTLPHPNGQVDPGLRTIVGIVRGSPLRYATTGAAIASVGSGSTAAAASVTHTIVASLPAAVVSRFVVDDQKQLVESNESDNTIVKCFTVQ